MGEKRRRHASEAVDIEDEVIVVELPFSAPKKQSNMKEPVMNNTPSKSRKAKHDIGTPTRAVPLVQRADRSARKKSARRLIERAAAANLSDEDELGQEDDLAQRIWDDDVGSSDDLGDREDPGEEEQNEELETQTPSKKPSGRSLSSKKERMLTPPRDLPPYEHYFYQNQTIGAKTSNNTLSALSLISHEDYFTTMSSYRDPHEPAQDFLHSLHSRSFDQWIFELSQGFNICVYGWGSKRELLLDFATHLSSTSPETKIIIIIGYNVSLNPRDMLNTLASTVPALSNSKLPAQPSDAATTIVRALASSPPTKPTVLLLNSLDGPSLRRPATQSLLGRLASSPHIHLLASADTPNFPLLWDMALATQFNWIFHDTTTFQPYDAEISGGGHSSVVDEVNTLLGRSGRKLQGREGVMYVLKSLTANARNLYALLVAELLSLEEDEEEEEDGEELADEFEDGIDFANVLGNPEGEDNFEAALGGAANGGGRSADKGWGKKRRRAGGTQRTIEYHSLYTKAMAQLITTNEVNYRGLLKEFYDHEMIVSRKDALGMELLSIPFRREEMQVLLGELVGD